MATLDFIRERMKSRRIKVAAFYTSLSPKLKIISSLRLTGAWLYQAGFIPGDLVAVEVAPGRLIITKKPAHL
jgi:hypothetical protein